jgi:hypothetical protein
MKKSLILLIIFFNNVFLIFSDEIPLMLDISHNDVVWLEGRLVIFNGWPPNIRMIVYNNLIIGIDEDTIPEEIYKNISFIIMGSFKLRFIGTTNLPYYEIPLLIFEIIEYRDLEIFKEYYK